MHATLTPLFGLILLQQGSTWLPQISLGVFCPADEVGVYNAAFRVANLTSLVLVGVNSVVFPRFAALHASQQHDRLKGLAQASTRIMAFACVPFLAVLLLLPGVVLSLFGAGFAEGALALRIIAVGQVVNVITGSVGGLLNMTGNQSISFRCSLISFLMMTLALVCLIPRFGLIGAALAQAIGVSTNMLCLSVACRYQLGFAPIGGISFSRKGSQPTGNV